MMGRGTAPADDDQVPLLPPRPVTAKSTETRNLQVHSTVAVTPLDVQTQSFPDGSRGTFTVSNHRSDPISPTGSHASPAKQTSTPSIKRAGDSANALSLQRTPCASGEIASLLTQDLTRKSPAVDLLQSQSASFRPFEKAYLDADDLFSKFEKELEDLPDVSAEHDQDNERLRMWKMKMKHCLIFSASGKPVWSRHGDVDLINSSVGVIRTIISFYEGTKNTLRGFTAGNARFVVLSQGPLYLVAISKLRESDAQLRAQLEALYMQILSTLTLPALESIFAKKPSSDLRKPLQGTEALLSSLADSFTRGSASTLLGSLECLKLRKSERHDINSVLLKSRAGNLLYGLLVANGRLVSVVRPRLHSLHPSDLQLIFNMLFKFDGIKEGGGDNWIPICLPAFNNRGYLYMYVSFLEDTSSAAETRFAALPKHTGKEEVAIILISADRESFFSLQQMKDKVAKQLATSGSLLAIKRAMRADRPSVAQIASGLQISHFLYKSRAYVQFCMASLQPAFSQITQHRRLMTLYHELHASVHARSAHLKAVFRAGKEAASLAWVTPGFELYCVGGPGMSRELMLRCADKVIQWVKREEQRLFIVSGGVF